MNVVVGLVTAILFADLMGRDARLAVILWFGFALTVETFVTVWKPMRRRVHPEFGDG